MFAARADPGLWQTAAGDLEVVGDLEVFEHRRSPFNTENFKIIRRENAAVVDPLLVCR